MTSAPQHASVRNDNRRGGGGFPGDRNLTCQTPFLEPLRFKMIILPTTLISVRKGGKRMLVSRHESERIRHNFEEFIRDKHFPCVGAKSALSRGSLRTMVAWSCESAWDDLKVHRELMEWAQDYSETPGLFRSFAVIFADPAPLTEEQFEAALWSRLQSLTDKDAWLGLPRDDRVSSDPSDPHFSLSFGGEAFFAVGLHPNASRPARRFERPVIVFNLHDQFEQLRTENRYETLREAILERDKSLAGSINPMLARHGETSEAAQYSGRVVDEEWQCPFHDPRAAA